MKYYSIAIDGPAGAGKSTIAKKIAKELGYIYIDTGAMYRAMGLYFADHAVSLEDEEAVGNACMEVDISIEFVNGEQRVLLNGVDVNDRIRTEEAGKMASLCSSKNEVRVKLVELQQQLAKKENVVMDGRDIGTKVLVDAPLKIYLTASSMVRATRRYEELIKKGIPCNLKEIEEDIIDRDYRDMNRDISPLVKAEDAILLDTSKMTIDEVKNHIITLFEKVMNQSN